MEEALRKRNYGLSILDRFLKIENERREFLRLIEERESRGTESLRRLQNLKRKERRLPDFGRGKGHI